MVYEAFDQSKFFRGRELLVQAKVFSPNALFAPDKLVYYLVEDVLARMDHWFLSTLWDNQGEEAFLTLRKLH